MNTSEKLAIGCLGAIGILALVAALWILSISVVAGLSMLVCNWALPLFDIHYPITFTQGCGVGVIVMVARALFQGIISQVTVKK